MRLRFKPFRGRCTPNARVPNNKQLLASAHSTIPVFRLAGAGAVSVQGKIIKALGCLLDKSFSAASIFVEDKQIKAKSGDSRVNVGAV